MKVMAAGIFLIKNDGKILICHPTNHAPNFWSIPKGKIEENESAIDAAIRETYEETNIKVLEYPFKIITLEAVQYKTKKKVLYPFIFQELYQSKIDWNSIDIKCNSNVHISRGGFPEMDDYRWVDIDEAANLLHESQVACLHLIKPFLR